MSSRKLVSVQEITNIEPIEGADRIEVARVLGWRVVVGKDMHLKPGDRVAYFETDSLLPAYDPRYKAFQARGQKTMIVGSMEITGHVLRTVKLRGVYSQGLIMRLDELGFRYTPAVGTDITDKANVLKYEEPLPMGGAQIGRFDAPCSKSDAPRLQTLTDHWDEIKTLKAVPTVKVDGTSTTLSMDERGQVHVYSRNWELDSMSSNMRLAKRFQLDKMLWPGMAVQFELCGPGIQSNRLKLPAQRPFVFAVWKDHHKIDRDQWPTGMPNLAVPELDEKRVGIDGERGRHDRQNRRVAWQRHQRPSGRGHRLASARRPAVVRGIGERTGSQSVLQNHQQQIPDEERTMSMAYPMFPLVSAPASYMPVPVDLVQRLASFTLAHPGEPGGLTADEIRHLNLPCGSYGYESEAVDAWLDELAEQLGKRQLF